jgi:hypothetical protein
MGSNPLSISVLILHLAPRPGSRSQAALQARETADKRYTALKKRLDALHNSHAEARAELDTLRKVGPGGRWQPRGR